MKQESLIDVAKLLKEEVGQSIVQDINIGEIAQDDLEIEKISGEAKLTNLSDRILIDFNLEAVLRAQCSRCLKDIKIPVKINEAVEFTKDYEIEKFQISPDNTIDLMPAIKEQIIINLPLKPLCSKNCKIENFNY